MARPKAFEPDEVVNLAMQAFWADGYERTSLQSLLSATGLSKSSLYDSFGDKHQLFVQCLECYARLQQRLLSESLREPVSAAAGTRLVLRQMADDSVDPRSPGCFMMNTVADLSGRDADVQRIAKANSLAIRRHWKAALERGMAEGSIRRDIDADALAGFLFGVVSSFRIQGRSGIERGDLYRQIESVMGLIEVRTS
jgi:TetR/AcrR family transcriptional regulator, transcriptional repressor for nem operon